MKTMFKGKIYAFVLLVVLCTSCTKEESENINGNNKVLLLKVDYLTNTFEGGKEFTFEKETPSFTIVNEYRPPSDFGKIKLTYKELNETLFDGSIIWHVKGRMDFPKNLADPTQFDEVSFKNVVYPTAGFENIFNVSNQIPDHSAAWLAIQSLSKVRDYLQSNPTEKVKLFLYTPSVGVGNPADWDWIILIKH